MRFCIRCHILLGLFLFLQLSGEAKTNQNNEKVLLLQSKVEQLIEKILTVIQEYYHQIKTQYKCIPDEVPDKVIHTLKESIDCVENNEKMFDQGEIGDKEHRKKFLQCFSSAKKSVEATIGEIDSTIDYCPENMTEKTYEINVTTSYTKTFHIQIKNGLEITSRAIATHGEEDSCAFHSSHEVPNDEEETEYDEEEDDDNEDEYLILNDDDEEEEDSHTSKPVEGIDDEYYADAGEDEDEDFEEEEYELPSENIKEEEEAEVDKPKKNLKPLGLTKKNNKGKRKNDTEEDSPPEPKPKKSATARKSDSKGLRNVLLNPYN